jgi:hypothetical protein
MEPDASVAKRVALSATMDVDFTAIAQKSIFVSFSPESRLIKRCIRWWTGSFFPVQRISKDLIIS